MKKGVIVGIALGVAIAIGVFSIGTNQQTQQQVTLEQQQSQRVQDEPSLPYDCAGNSGCFIETVSSIIDGDTIYTDTLKIRLSLANTPEKNESGYLEAAQFTETLCPVGSRILVDQDDLQPVDTFGRVLAKVYCGNNVLNSELLNNGYANILTQYCSTSEFSSEAWAQNYGCANESSVQTKTESTQTKQNCDSSYPTVCIPPPPPDLDCGEISHRNFKVLQPDQHRFDGDKDGIGCEG